MTCTLEDCMVLICDKKISQVKEILPLLEGVSSQNKSLLIIAEDIDNEALATMIVNKIRGTLKICAVKAPEFGDRRKLILEDIAILTGGQVFTSDKGMKFEKFSWDWFGQVRLVTITKDQTTIVDGKGSEETINTRIEELQKQIEKAQTPFEREKLQERLAKFTGGVAIVHVGGNTETEIKEKKDRVEDALHATKAALEEGVVPGGGITLLKARNNITDRNNLGAKIVYKACSMPFTQILKNAGYDNDRIYSLITDLNNRDNWDGYNLKEENIVNMKEAGIIDPAKVSRVALENAVSVASTILLTEATIVDKPEEKKNNNEYNPMMGMM
jgi:chaperonin GroEL